jgi:hypothetical protein
VNTKRLQSDCKVIAKRLQSDCKAIAKRLQGDCKAVAKRLQGDCKPIARRLQGDCKAIARRLQSDCKAIAKRLQSDCKAIAKRLQSDCKAELRPSFPCNKSFHSIPLHSFHSFPQRAKGSTEDVAMHIEEMKKKWAFLAARYEAILKMGPSKVGFVVARWLIKLSYRSTSSISYNRFRPSLFDFVSLYLFAFVSLCNSSRPFTQRLLPLIFSPLSTQHVAFYSIYLFSPLTTSLFNILPSPLNAFPLLATGLLGRRVADVRGRADGARHHMVRHAYIHSPMHLFIYSCITIANVADVLICSYDYPY